MSPPVLRLFLARHGETSWNRDLRYLGSVDEPLADSGVEQAESLAAALAGFPLRAVYSSPLARARETARRIAEARGVGLRLDPRLREQDFGLWEGLTRGQVLERDRERLLRWEGDLSLAPPDGESLESVQARILALVGELAGEYSGGSGGSGESVALVSHVGPIKALLCAALGAPLATARRLFLDPGTVSVLDWGETPVIRLFNAHVHLGWESARWMARDRPQDR